MRVGRWTQYALFSLLFAIVIFALNTRMYAALVVLVCLAIILAVVGHSIENHSGETTAHGKDGIQQEEAVSSHTGGTDV